MTLLLLLGGARSGKSDLAVRLAARQSQEVTLIATAHAGDDEMAQRIERHRAERPAGWRVVETPTRLREAIASATPAACLLIDCLTLWTSNLIDAQNDDAIAGLATGAALAAADRPGLTIAISNEVGLGIVPANPLARRYRDLHGRVNAIWAAQATHTYLLLAGRLLPLYSPEEISQELMV